jgi:hypothetical protein
MDISTRLKNRFVRRFILIGIPRKIANLENAAARLSSVAIQTRGQTTFFAPHACGS